MLFGGILDTYLTYNFVLHSNQQKELMVKQAPYIFGYGYGYGFGGDYFDVLDTVGDQVGFGINDFDSVNSWTFGYGYGYERMSDKYNFKASAYVDELYITNLGTIPIKVGFESSTAIAEGKYFIVPASSCVGPIKIRVRNAIYVQQAVAGTAQVSVLGTMYNKY